MPTVIDRTESVAQSRSTTAFEHSENAAQLDRGRVTQQKVDVVCFPSERTRETGPAGSNGFQSGAKKRQVRKHSPRKLRTEQAMHGQVTNLVACCVKVKVPDSLTGIRNDLSGSARGCVDRMLQHRKETPSKYHPEIPCVIAKSLSAKYQRNKKCQAVKNLVLPICGDVGKQIKREGNGIRIPAMFKKAVLPVPFPRPVIGWVRSIEFFRRAGEWQASVCYYALAEESFKPTGTVGVDRNSVGAVATLADPPSGKVLHLGFNPAPTQRLLHRLLHKVRNKQSRRTKHENHIVSKKIVDYAATHRRAMVVEELENVRRGKIHRYVEKSQWSFYQLLQFILYKAALRGVMVIETDPACTSRECSRCHQLTKPNGECFRCPHCGHKDHRDAHAAFSLSERVIPIGGFATESESRSWGLWVAPFLGTEAQQCA
jgi:putative transposase